MGWEDIDSSNHESDCGSNAPQTPQAMLDGTDIWSHVVNHVHVLVIDLNSSKLVTKIRTKSNGVGSALPNDIDIFVSDDTGDFGTAVETGIDISSDPNNSFTERILTTQKTGRYIKIQINSTQSAFNFLGWGADDQKVLDFFTGAIPKRWTSVINLTAKNFTTASGSFVPTDGSITLLDWDGSKYSNIIEAYFEANGAITGGGEGKTWGVQLYDRTNSNVIASVGSEGNGLKRSNDISGNLPSGAAVFDVRVANNGGTNSAQKNSRLIIVQEETGTNKMRIYLPVGQGFSILDEIYKPGSGVALSPVVEHQYKWLTNNFESIDAAYFHANIDLNSGTGFVKLDSVDEDDAMGELSTSNTFPTLLKSSDISGSLTDTTIYTTYIKSSGRRDTVTNYNSWIVVDLDPVQKFEFTYDIAAFGKREATNTGWQTHDDYQVTYNTGDMWFFGCDSENVTHAVVSGKSGGVTSITTAVYDDGVRDATSEQIETSTGANYNEDTSIATIANDSIIRAGWNVSNIPFLASANMWMHNLLVQIEIGIVAVTRRIFVI